MYLFGSSKQIQGTLMVGIIILTEIKKSEDGCPRIFRALEGFEEFALPGGDG
jgi:hypothetical protein